jgi:hypothetical protein
MSETFHDVGSIDYPIIDADAHVNEPPELWQEGVPAKWRERAPRVEHSERGDMWIFDGGKERWPVGLTATAGQSPFQIGPMGQTYATMRRGSFDTEARLADLDADGIHAQVLYPSVTLKGARIYSEERELQLACVRAYNDWLLSFTRPSGGRLIGQAIVPTTGLDDAIAELDYAMKSGHKGAVISSFPNGTLHPQADDEPFWARRSGSLRSPSSRAPPGRRPAGRRSMSPAICSSRASSSVTRGFGCCSSSPTSAGSRRCSSRPTTCSVAIAGGRARTRRCRRCRVASSIATSGPRSWWIAPASSCATA